MDSPHGKDGASREQALSQFLKLLKERFLDKSDDTYQEFTDVMTKYLQHEIESDTFLSEANTIFSGRPDLISQFNIAFPQILPPSVSVEHNPNKHVSVDKKLSQKDMLYRYMKSARRAAERTIKINSEQDPETKILVRKHFSYLDVKCLKELCLDEYLSDKVWLRRCEVTRRCKKIVYHLKKEMKELNVIRIQEDKKSDMAMKLEEMTL